MPACVVVVVVLLHVGMRLPVLMYWCEHQVLFHKRFGVLCSDGHFIGGRQVLANLEHFGQQVTELRQRSNVPVVPQRSHKALNFPISVRDLYTGPSLKRQAKEGACAAEPGASVVGKRRKSGDPPGDVRVKRKKLDKTGNTKTCISVREAECSCASL